MPWPATPLPLGQLCNRLIDDLRQGVCSGALTVRRLAKEVGVSQPHMQNIMSGKRALTIQMADRLLRYQKRSALDLATSSELGEALGQSTTTSDAVRYVPVLPGRLGPSHPFPELKGETLWRSLPRQALAGLVRPVFVELGPDAELSVVFPGASFALLDLSTQTAPQISERQWYALRWSGGGWIRQIRLEPREILILGQEGFRPLLGPIQIDLRSSNVQEHVRAQVIWMGQDPESRTLLQSSGYLVPPPATDW